MQKNDFPHTRRSARRENYSYCVFPRLRHALRKSGLSSAQLAQAAGISRSNLYRWLTGGNAHTLLTVFRLLALAGLSYEEAFTPVDEGGER